MAYITDKQSIRRRILDLRLQLPQKRLKFLSSLVQGRFLKLLEFKMARKLALYSSFKNEVQTDDILNISFSKGKEVFFPRVVSGECGLIFIKKEKEDNFSNSVFCQPEHKHDSTIDKPSDCDLIVVPGIAFDSEGNRLGYGKGYYDRALKDAHTPLIALAFEFQLVNSIPSEIHDVKVNKIVTEKRVIKAQPFSD